MHHYVTAGTNLQAVIDAAEAGDVIELEASATFPSVALTAKSGRVELRGRGIIQSTKAGTPAVRTVPRGHFWWMHHVILRASGLVDILRLGSTNQKMDEVPRELLIEWNEVDGGAGGASRGIQINCADSVIDHNSVEGIFYDGRETHAICWWNTPGGNRITWNRLHAGSIGYLSGGWPPTIPGIVPSDILLEHNHIFRLPTDRERPEIEAKNLGELKCGVRIVARHNTYDYNWAQAQNGYAILFTVRASKNEQSGASAPWNSITDCAFTHNLVRHVANGINILGTDTNRPSGRVEGLLIAGNTFCGIDGPAWGGAGRFLQLSEMPRGVTVKANTVENTGEAVYVGNDRTGARQPAPAFSLLGNALVNGRIRGDGKATAASTASSYLAEAQIEGNEFGDEASAGRLAENFYRTGAEIRADYFGAAPTKAGEPGAEWLGDLIAE